MGYAGKNLKTPIRCASNGATENPGVLRANRRGVPTSLFHHIAIVVGGREELADIIGRTKSLVDQQITGVKNDPMDQCRGIIRRLLATGYKDLAGLVAQEVANELKGVVFSEEEVSQLRALAAKGESK